MTTIGSKPLIAVFSGATATIQNTPPLITSNPRFHDQRSWSGLFLFALCQPDDCLPTSWLKCDLSH